MAKKTIENQKAEFNKITKISPVAATTAADGFEINLSESDEYTVFFAENTGTAAGTIKVKAPTSGSYAATDTDLSKSLAAGEKAVIRIESARFANNDGTVIIIPSSTDIKVAAIN